MKRSILALLCLLLAKVAVSAALSPEQVAQRVKEWQPKAEEKIFDQIGWAEDIRHGLRLAVEHERPLFVFTHDGRMNLGRC
jgi:hypothetical protein